MVEHDLQRYVPRIALDWDDSADPTWLELDGTLVFVDISGFTALSERLARFGRVGAEELTGVLNRVFSQMQNLCYERGGSLLKFGGDALLLLFTGDDHAVQACGAAVEMRSALRDATSWRTSVGRLGLKMSVGVHSGTINLFRVGASHTELLVTGPVGTTTTLMEKTAEAGEIVVSDATRGALPPGSATAPKGPGWLLRWRQPATGGPGPIAHAAAPLDRVLEAIPVALREHLRHGRAEAEHRLATIGFVHFEGVDRLLESNGPGAVAAALGELIVVVEEAADREDVTFLASDLDADGGKVILAAGVPVLREDDEGRMLRAVRRIADARTTLPLRIGVNRGHVFSGEIGTEYRCAYTVMGDTVNVAARLMAAAGAGDVLSTPAVLDSSRSIFTVTELEPLRVKGKTDALRAYAVGMETGDRAGDANSDLDFAGRDRELELVRSVVRRELGAPSRVVVVGGRGLGKTRLVNEALAGTAARAVLTVHAEPYSATTPFQALRDPLRRLLDLDGVDAADLAQRLDTAVAGADASLLPLLPLIGDVTHIAVPPTTTVTDIEPRFRADRLADAVEALLVAMLPSPAVLFVDDGHWVDESSSQLLSRLAARADANGWAIVVTRREDRGGFTPDDAATIALPPLELHHIESLVIAATAGAPLRPHDIAAIARRGDGNPLYVNEIVRAVREAGSVDALPESVDAVVSAQIDRLAPLSRRALRYASVLGIRVPRTVLEEILATEGFQLGPAARRGLDAFLARDGTDHVRFRHAMFQEVAYEGLSYQRRREVHRLAGEAIERLHADELDSVADLLGLHFERARDDAKAWHYARVAGETAMRACANVEAARHFERALAAARGLTGVTDLERADVWVRLGDVREQAGVFDGALDAYRRATKLVADDPVFAARTLLRRARARERAGSFSHALRELSLGIGLLDGVEMESADGLRANLLALSASVRQAQGRFGAALIAADRAAAASRAASELGALARALTVMDWANLMLGRFERVVHARDALALYEEIGDLDGQAGVMTTLGADAYYRGRWNEAVDWYARSREVLLRAGNTWQAAGMGMNIGEVLINQGRLHEAEPLLREADRVLTAAGFRDGAAFAEMQLGRLLAARGELEAADELLERSRTTFASLGIAGAALEATIHLVDCRTQRGGAAASLELLDAAVVAAGEEGAVLGAAVARVRARTLMQLGRHDDATSCLADGLAMARGQGLPYDEALLLRARSELDLAAGREPDVIDLATAERMLAELSAAAPD